MIKGAYINFDTGDSISTCSTYQANNICYSECPSDMPYIDGSYCVESCPFYTEISTKKCYGSDSGKYYYRNYLYSSCPSSAIYHKGNFPSSPSSTSCESEIPIVGYVHYRYGYSSSCIYLSSQAVIKSSDSQKCLICTPPLLYDPGKGTSNSCVSSCPTERPYVDEYNECNAECSGVAKYYTYGTKNCKTKCDDNEYEFNYVCYTTCPSDTNGITDANGSKKCQCDNKYFIESVGDDKFVTTCLSENEPCPISKKYLVGKECVATPPTEGCSYLRKIIILSNEYYKCVSQCESGEFEYQKGLLTNNKYCLTECPLDFPYKDTTTTPNKCSKKCTNNYVDESSKTCLSVCPEFSYFDENDNTLKGKCFSGAECPSSYPYLYETSNSKVCLKKCQNLLVYAGEPSFSGNYYISEEEKRCYAGACGNGLYLECTSSACTCSLNECKCYKSCKTIDKFGFNNKCYTSCNSQTGYSTLVPFDETNECVFSTDTSYINKYYYTYSGDPDSPTPTAFYANGCPSNTYQQDSTRQCHTKSGCPKKIFESTKKCDDCEEPTVNNLPNEGYYIGDTGSTDKTCYSKCPDAQPYYYKNQCYSLVISGKKRVYGTNQFVDYLNNECPDFYYYFNDMCYYESCPTNSQINDKICECKYKYYEPERGQKVCLGPNDPCPLDYKYHSNKKCSSELCSGTYMRKTSFDPENLECLSDTTLPCQTNEYYYELSINGQSKTICIEKCPDNFPYLPGDATTGPKKCESKCDEANYFTDESNHLCYTECPDYGYNLLNTDGTNDVSKKGKCIKGSICPLDAPYLYTKTKTCLAQCNTANYKFFNNVVTYLDSSINQCVESCTLYDLSNRNCVNECSSTQFLDVNGNHCVSRCEFFYLSETRQCISNSSSTGCYDDSRDYYRDSDMAKYICYKTCPTGYYSFDDDNKDVPEKKKICYNDFTYSNKYLLENSDKKLVYCNKPDDSDAKEISKGFKYGTICYKKCPIDAPYFKTGTNECSKSCPYTHPLAKNSTNECVEDEDTTCTGYAFNNICYDICPSNTIALDPSSDNKATRCGCVDKFYTKYITSTQTVIVCLEPGKPCPISYNFYDPSSKECKTTCSGPRRKINNNGNIYYECRSCNNDEYEYTDSSNVVFCMSQCPTDKPYHVVDVTDDKSCMTRSECNTKNYFRNDNELKCYKTCSGLMTIDETHSPDTDKNIVKEKCITDNVCPPNKPYSYVETGSTYCLSDCSLTDKYDQFKVGASYITTKLDIVSKKCVSVCDSNKYLDVETDTCVDSCRSDQFTYGNKCFSTSACGVQNGIKLKYGTNICIETCGKNGDDYIYTLDGDTKYCYKECPEGTYKDNRVCRSTCQYYIDETGKNCVSLCSDFIFSKTCVSKCPATAPYYIIETDVKKDCYDTGCPISSTYSSKNKVTIETNECVSDCDADEVLFNYGCYKDCPSGTEKTDGGDECKCIYNYYKKAVANNKEYDICLDVNEACPSEKPYISADGECTSTACTLYRRILSTIPINYQCESKCTNSEFIYTFSSTKYCVTKCPEETPYYFINTDGIKECTASCDSNKYYTDDTNHVCVETCNNYYTIDETATSIKNYKCVNEDSCPTSRPFLFVDVNKKYCLASCDSTTKFEPSKTTYLDRTLNQCVTTNDCTGKYYDFTTKICVEKCSTIQYIESNICYDICPDTHYTIEEKKKCVRDCKSEGYYSNSVSTDKNCYSICPTGYNTDETNKKCYYDGCSTSSDPTILKLPEKLCIKECKNPSNRNQPGKEEGFKYSNNLCLDKCPDDKPYTNLNENVCYAIDGAGLQNFQIYGTNMFTQDSTGKKCSTDYYLFNNMCYSSCPENTKASNDKCECEDKYYETQKPSPKNPNNKLTDQICLKVNEPCPSNKAYFASDNKCLTDCPTNPAYIIREIKNGDIINYKCETSCDPDEFIYKNNNGNKKYCVEKCPETAPYYVFGATTKNCYVDCETAKTEETHSVGYYTDLENKICYENCPNLSTIDESEDTLTPQNCVSSCPTDHSYKYTVNDNKKYCLSNCSNAAKIQTGLSLIKNEKDLTCVSSCGEKFVSDAACVDSCPKYFYNKVCYNDCGTGFIGYIFETKQCLQSVTETSGLYRKSTNDKIYYQKCPDDAPYVEGNLCKSESGCISGRYAKVSVNKCVLCNKPVDPNAIQEDEGYIFGTKCLLKCEEGYYFNYGSNYCMLNTGSGIGRYYIRGTNMYTNDCPDNYYLFNYECYKTQCPENTYYDNTNQKCICSYKFKITDDQSKEYYTCFPKTQSCPAYFDPIKGCVGSCETDGRDKIKVISNSEIASNKECVAECNSLTEFIYNTDSLIYCVQKCPDDKKYHVLGQNTCLSSCSSDNYYTSESDLTCRDDCEGLKTLDETANSNTGAKGKCLTDDKCPNGYYLYEKTKTCLTSCSKTETLSKIFSGDKLIKTYTHEDTTRQCVPSCKDMINLKYSLDDKCVNECPKLIYEYTCHNDCAYTPIDNADGNYIEETKTCNLGCSGYYTISGATGEEAKKCFITCPEKDSSGNKLFILDSDTKKTCTKCDGENNFYIEGDSRRKCYTKCPDEAKYFITGTHKCIEECNVFPYIYILSNNNECVTSCGDYLKQNNLCHVGGDCDSSLGFVVESDTRNCICNTSNKKFVKILDNYNNEYLVCNLDDCPIDKPILNSENNECVSVCPEGTYTDDEDQNNIKCYKTDCGNEKYKNLLTNKCTTYCNPPANLNNIQQNEGFIIGTDKICYSECSVDFPYYNEGSNICLSDCDNSGDFIYKLEDKKICVKNCPNNYYLFNNICYKNKCPENSEYDYNTKMCKCKYKYYETTINSINYKICLSENEACPSDKNFFDSNKKCTSSCNLKMKKDSTDYECVSDCGDDFIYENSGKNYCVKECPNGKLYHKENDKNCIELDGCEDLYLDESKNECVSSCNLFTIVEYRTTEKIKGKCLQGNSCPTFPKIYYSYELSDGKKACLTSCAKTENTDFGTDNKKTYTDFEENQNTNSAILRCVPDCSTNAIKKYSDSVKSECVENCGENSGGEYLYNGICYSSCTTINGNYYYIFDTKECVEKCPDDYYKYEHVCYKTCPDFDSNNKPLYTNLEKKQCVKCSNPSDPAHLTAEEGYITIDNSKICYTTCPNQYPYFNKKKNKCFSGGCSSTNNPYPLMIYSKYQIDQNNKEYICYSDCTDIFGAGSAYILTENNQCVSGTNCPDVNYNYQYNNVCYKDKCPYENMKTNIQNNGLILCENYCQNNYYLQGTKCVSECDSVDYPYKIEKSSTNVGICFTSADKCANSVNQYYDETSKICKNTCENKKIETDPLTGKPLISSGGTCVQNCPSDFPYEYNSVCYRDGCPSSAPYIYLDNNNAPYQCKENCGNDYEDGNICVTSCKNRDNKYISEINGIKRCVNKCESPNQFYSDKKCLSECKSGDDYIYYDPETLECKTSCTGDEYPFYVTNVGKHSPCMRNCQIGSGFQFYYKNEKKCLNSCPKYYSSNDVHICVDECENDELIIKDLKICTKTCPSSYPYEIDLTENSKTVKYCYYSCNGAVSENSKPFKYILDSTKKCVQKCENNENFLYNDVCYKKCPDEVPYYKIFDDSDSSNIIYECYADCFKSTNFYHNYNSYECINKCEEGGNYVVDGSYICRNSCPDDYPYYYPLNPNNIYTCTDKCAPSIYVTSDNKCLLKCDEKNPYLGKITKVCYNSCSGNYPYYYKDQSSLIYCVSNCDSNQYIFNGILDGIYGQHCVNDCPIDANYIGNNQECKGQCTSNDGLYYFQSGSNYAPDNSIYYIYTCVNSCNNVDFAYNVIGTNQCYKNCPNNYYADPNRICYEKCEGDYPYMLDHETKGKICVKNCQEYSTALEYTDETEKKCVSSCQNTLAKVADENNKCVSSCVNKDIYRFQSNYQCVKFCPSNKRYYTDDLLCIDKCDRKDNNYVLPSGECSSACDQNTENKYGYEQNGEIICTNKCPDPNKKYYYLDKNICISSCPNYVKDGTNECMDVCYGDYPIIYVDGTVKLCAKNCYNTKKYIFKESEDKQYCAENCSGKLPYYLISSKVCIDKCPDGYNFVQTADGYQCEISCNEAQYLYYTGKCLDICPPYNGDYKFYYEEERVCLKKCKTNAPYYYDQKCYSICPDDYKYDDDNKCVDKCPNGKRFFVKDINETTGAQLHCKQDCDIDHQYYIEETIQGTPDVVVGYACLKECPPDYGYFKSELGKYRKECMQSCDSPTKFYNENKECLTKCPDDAPYYIPGSDQDIACLKECPQNKYHNIDEYECIDSCTTSNYRYYDKENKRTICVKECTSKQIKYDPKITGSSEIWCLDNCSDVGGYIKPDGTCVDKCQADENLKISEDKLKCDCLNLYYFDEVTGIKNCITSSINICTDSGNSGEYKTPVENSKECVKKCQTVKSPQGYCLLENKCPENTKLVTNSDYTQKCVCLYKFYKNDADQNICLGKEESCPIGYNLIIEETNECVNSCPTDYEKKFNGKCYKTCPSYTTETANECKCINYWITNDEGEMECLNGSIDCPGSKPLVVKETKECVSVCPDFYPILYNSECLLKCGTDDFTKVSISSDDSQIKYAKYTCLCKYIWFYNDVNQVECTNLDKSSKNCLDVPKDTTIDNGNNILQIKETGQCVSECPEKYPYRFNYECYSNCDVANSYNDNKLQKKNNNECECKGVYIFETETYYNKVFTKCDEHCDFSTQLYIESLRECIDQAKNCPQNYKYQFNKICYDKCPENSVKDNINGLDICTCKNLWYYFDNEVTRLNDEIYCISESITTCPPNKQYLNEDTRECTDDFTNFPYFFNDKGYEKGCPPKTVIDTDNSIGAQKICKCDSEYYWYIDDSNLNNYYVCGLEKCPDEKPYNEEETNQCFYSCKNIVGTYKTFKYTCYKNNCPTNTIENQDDDSICEYKPLKESDDFNELKTLISVGVKDYYEAAPKGGILINDFGASTQIFGIDKNVDSYKNVLTKDNLTYVDFGKCMDKIYEANGLEDSDKLIVVKFDILNNQKAYEIYPVEYELYSAKTGKKVDFSVCANYEILISYPLSDQLNSENRRLEETEKKNFTLRQLFEMGKKIHEKNSKSDTFNSQNEVYNNLCSSIQIDGKDLILRERPDYLFPTNKSFCENNCTYAYTDFETERVNCYCPIKEFVDYDRKHYEKSNEISIDIVEDKQNGPTNIPVIKCIKEFEAGHNGAFYYCLFILIVQIVLGVFAFVFNFTNLKNKIMESVYGKNYIETNNTDNNGDEIVLKKKKASEEDVMTENRMLKFSYNSNRVNNGNNINNNVANPPPKNVNDRISKNTEELEEIQYEYIPNKFNHLFFTAKDNGVVKQIKRNKLPFYVDKNTKLLYENVDVTENSNIKRNIIRIVEVEDEEGKVIDNGELSDKYEVCLKDSLERIKEQKAQDGGTGQKQKQTIFVSKKVEKSVNLDKESIQENEFNKDELYYERKKYIVKDEDISKCEKSINEIVDRKDLYNEDDLLSLIRRENRYKEFSFESALKKNFDNIQITMLTFVVDKIYFTRTILLRRKYDMFCALLSLYLLYHMIILSIVTMFFNLNIISKIFWDKKYPGLSFYLAYGLWSNLLSWLIYKLFACLVNNNKKILNFLARFSKDSTVGEKESLDKDVINKKVVSLKNGILYRLIAFYIIDYAVTLYCFFYLILFCSVYKGTKGNVFKTYGIALFEIFIIRVVYGIILAALRYLSLYLSSETLYKAVKFFDIYLS